MSRIVRPSQEAGSIRPIYAGVFDLEPKGYEHARDVVLDWLRGHHTLRAHADVLHEIPLDFNHLIDEGLLAQVQVDEDNRSTVVRLQHLHWDRDGRHFDRARNWRTEVTIERDDEQAWIATRQWYLGFRGDPVVPSVPGFVRSLWREGALSDLDVLEPNARRLEHTLEADALAHLILDADRDLPVVVLADGCPLDEARVAADSIGLAHVFKISGPVRLALLAAIDGLDLRHGALQTFSPRVGNQPPFIRAARFETIVAWRYANLDGPAAFASWLHDQLARIVVLRLLNDPAHHSIEAMKTEAIQARLTSLAGQHQDAGTLAEQMDLANLERELLQSEVVDLNEQLVELTERAAEFSRERERAEQALREERERNHSLQQDKAALQYALSKKRGEEQLSLTHEQVEELIAEQPAPRNLLDAVEQAERIFNLYGLRVRLSDETLESAMDALAFKRPAQVQEALLRLGFFWDTIRSSGQRLDQAATRMLGLPTVMFESERTMRQYGGQRMVRIDDGTVTLQKHIKLGSGGKGESARIYFGDKDGELLIGHVGHHLDVASTQ